MTSLPAASDAEAEIRAATVMRIRELFPTARVIHELNVEQGVVRADVAAVTEDRLYLFEIKSHRDTLARLGNQVRHFVPVCHGLVVVADEKWCGRATEAGFPNCDARAIVRFHCGRTPIWQWPEPDRAWGRDWIIPTAPSVPWHHRMLRLLWTDELRNVARDGGLTCTSRTPGHQLCRDLASALTGRDIERAVCGALQSRSFAWADPAIAQIGRAA